MNIQLEIKSMVDNIKIRYPNCDVKEGLPRSTDVEDKKYISVVIGGEKKEGDSFPLWTNYSPFDSYLWDMWWKFFDDFAKDAKRIYVRTPAQIVNHRVYELNMFDHDIPTVVSENKTQIVGRFSFHYE